MCKCISLHKNIMRCKRCGSKTNRAGTKAYVTGIYQMRRCTRCGHQFRGELIKKIRGR